MSQAREEPLAAGGITCAEPAEVATGIGTELGQFMRLLVDREALAAAIEAKSVDDLRALLLGALLVARQVIEDES